MNAAVVLALKKASPFDVIVGLRVLYNFFCMRYMLPCGLLVLLKCKELTYEELMLCFCINPLKGDLIVLAFKLQ